VSWDNLADRAVIGKDLLKEMEEQMTNIKKNLKASWDRKKIYANKNIIFVDFKVGEHVFLKVKGKNNFSKIRKLPKVGSKILWTF
jgi:hypothetical protein